MYSTNCVKNLGVLSSTLTEEQNKLPIRQKRGNFISNALTIYDENTECSAYCCPKIKVFNVINLFWFFSFLKWIVRAIKIEWCIHYLCGSGVWFIFPLCKYALKTSRKLMVLATDADLYILVHAFKYNFKWKCVCVCFRVIISLHALDSLYLWKSWNSFIA